MNAKKDGKVNWTPPDRQTDCSASVSIQISATYSGILRTMLY